MPWPPAGCIRSVSSPRACHSIPSAPTTPKNAWRNFFPPIRYLRIHYLRVSYDFLRIFMASIPARIPELQQITQVFQPSVVVAGPLTFAAQLFCEQQTLPWAVLSPMTHFMSPSLHAPPAGFPRVETMPAALRLPYRLGLKGALRTATILMAPWRFALNRYRRQLSLLPHADPLSPHVVAPYLLIHTCSREYDYNRPDLPPQVHYVGPSVWDRPIDWQMPSWLAEVPQGKPLVYVSLGTVFNTRLSVFRKNYSRPRSARRLRAGCDRARLSARSFLGSSIQRAHRVVYSADGPAGRAENPPGSDYLTRWGEHRADRTVRRDSAAVYPPRCGSAR